MFDLIKVQAAAGNISSVAGLKRNGCKAFDFWRSLVALPAIAVFIASCATIKHPRGSSLVISEQGAFSAGGSLIKSEGQFNALKPWNEPQGGQTRHGDHADVFYQIPAKAKKYPLVFLHGYGQSKRTWQTTADGREGFSDMFLRAGYSTYLVDQPGRGDAGQTIKPVPIAAKPDDQTWYTQFRIGLYPEFNPGVQFPMPPARMLLCRTPFQYQLTGNLRCD